MPAITDIVFESGPLMNVPSSENMPNSAPMMAVIKATVMPKPTYPTSGPENSSAP